MNISGISTRIQAQKREQKKDAAAAGLTGAFWGGAAGIMAGNLKKPDIFEYSQTIDKIGKKELKNTQKSLRKIADAMDNNKELSKNQKNLLESLEMTDYSSKQVRKSASLMDRTNDTTAIVNRLEGKIEKFRNHIETLTNIDPNITPGSEMEKSLLNKFIQDNPNEFTVINDAKKAELKSFNNIEEAVSFLEGRTKKYLNILEKTVKVREANLAIGIDSANFIKETFNDKKNAFRNFIVDEFKASKAKKYAVWGALSAGVAAMAADFASNAHSKKIFVPVEKIVPMPVPVPSKLAE